MGLAGLWVALVLLPPLVIPADEIRDAQGKPNPNARHQRQNEFRTVAVQALGGLVLAFGGLYTARAFRIAREGHFTDRLTAAVGQLGEGEDVAVGGIFALERLAVDSPRDRVSIIELLAIYISRHAPVASGVPTDPSPRTPLPKPVANVQAALSVVARRAARDTRESESELDLSGIDLRGADLREANLDALRLELTDLAGARLSGASGSGVSLFGADLTRAEAIGVSLPAVDLRGAWLSFAKLGGADLEGATLTGARLNGAFMASARLTRADLAGVQGDEQTVLYLVELAKARLVEAQLPGALLAEADLSEAEATAINLRGADLRLVRLGRADLRGADLRGATLVDADLREADLREARLDDADLRGAEFADANLDGASLERVRRDAGDPPLRG